MISNSYKPNWKLITGSCAAIFITCYGITFTPLYKQHLPTVSLAILADLLITAPLIYLLLIRNTNVSKLTVFRVFIIGMLLAGMMLNTAAIPALQIIKKWVSPVLEATLIFFVARKFYVANKETRLRQHDKPDFLTHCRSVLKKVTGNEKISNALSSEIAVFYYAFIARKEKNIDGVARFSSYKENSVILFLVTFLCLFLIETTGVHFLLMLWNKTVAWIISGLSIYACLQLFAHIRAIKARPIRIGHENLKLAMGLAADCSISFNNILRVEMTKSKSADPKAVKIALIKGLESHNFIISLKEPVEVIKMFGIKRKASTILFFADKPAEFLHALNAGL
jgi:hypothetical protein